MAKELKRVYWDGMNSFVELFDEQFSVSDFGDSVKEAEIQSESILDSARSAIRKAYEKKEPESKLVLDMNDDIKRAIENGEARLDTGKNGEVYAQLRCANGRLGGKISVKEELQEEGITIEELKFAMQMEAIKDYDEVSAEYVRYSYKILVDENGLQDRLDVLDMLENTVYKNHAITNVSIAGNTVSLSFSGLDFNETAQLIQELQSYEMVSSVQVNNQTGNTGNGTYSGNMVIALTQPGGEQ